jgi:hypothetical protein
MIRALFSRVSRFHKRALALFHRTDQPAADAVERRERWNQLIAGYQKAPEQQGRTSTSSIGGTTSGGEPRA